MALARKVDVRPEDRAGKKNGAAVNSPGQTGQRKAASTGGTPQRSGAGRFDRSSTTVGARTIAESFGIDESSLATRREFIRLGPEESTRLTALIPWARSTAPQIVKEFYDWQFAFGPTRRFFENYAQSGGMSLSQLRQALERTQADFFIQIFEGAEENWGLSYFERRLKAGVIHDKINLPFKWYIGSSQGSEGDCRR